MRLYNDREWTPEINYALNGLANEKTDFNDSIHFIASEDFNAKRETPTKPTKEQELNHGQIRKSENTSLSRPAATVMMPPVLLLMVNMLDVGLSGVWDRIL